MDFFLDEKTNFKLDINRILNLEMKTLEYSTKSVFSLEEILFKSKDVLIECYEKLIIIWNKNYKNETTLLGGEHLVTWNSERKEIAFAIKKIEKEIAKCNDEINVIKNTNFLNISADSYKDLEDVVYEFRFMAEECKTFTKPFWNSEAKEALNVLVSDEWNHLQSTIKECKTSLEQGNKREYENKKIRLLGIIDRLEFIQEDAEKRLYDLYLEKPILPLETWTPKNNSNANSNRTSDSNVDLKCNPEGLVYKNIEFWDEVFSKKISNSISETNVENSRQESIIEKNIKETLLHHQELNHENIESIIKLEYIRSEYLSEENSINFQAEEKNKLVELFSKEIKEFMSEAHPLPH